MAGGSSGGVVLIDGDERQKIKGLLESLAEIEQTYVFEQSGGTVDENYFTTKEKLEFFGVGLKGVLSGSIIMLVLLPLMIDVFYKNITVFTPETGTFYMTFDRVYVLCLSMGITLGTAGFFIYISTFNGGIISQAKISSLFWGVSFGFIIKIFISFFIYGMLYNLVITQQNIVVFLNWLDFFDISYTLKGKLYNFIMNMKDTLMPSLIFLVITTIIMTVMIWLGYFAGKRKKKKMNSGGFDER